MILELATALTLAQQCAPTIAPETLLSIVQVESGFNPLALNVNGAADPRPPHTKAEAIRTAVALIRQGQNIDLGLAQINSKNLVWLGLSVTDAFDPCRNLAAAAKVLEAGYVSAAQLAPQQQALRMAFSAYNTGSHARGFRNGYVAKVEAAAGKLIPAISANFCDANATHERPLGVRAALEAAAENLQEPPAPELKAASWDVFGRAGGSRVHVFAQVNP
ncbi:lytic transglycosylase domain-containing protein [Phenylobacterium sp. LjRoot225]|uniref:lytic transglycosylase domain-containing protein n=1 Tax=Phenylobacterium sp. LjRoot225 TaxID=3342285 RepID=UPI003ECD6F55